MNNNIQAILDAAHRRYICAAVDRDQTVYLFSDLPVKCKTCWDASTGIHFTNVRNLIEGELPHWEDSLIYRTGYQRFKRGELVCANGLGSLVFRASRYAEDGKCFMATTDYKTADIDNDHDLWTPAQIIPFDPDKVGTV